MLSRFQSFTQPILCSDATFPAVALQIEKIVNKHRLAFEQVETVATEATAHCRDHSLRAAFWNRHIGGDGVVLIQNAGSIAAGNIGILTRKSEKSSPSRRARSRRCDARKDRVVQRQDVVFPRLRQEQRPKFFEL